MADAYATFGKFLLLKRRTQDGLGTLWRSGEMERTGFKRIVWLRRFDQAGLDRAALTAEIASANQVAQSLRTSNVVRNASYGTDGGVPYVAWDYVPAQPLDQLLARAAEEQFPIAIDNALLIVEKLAAALAAAAALEVHGEPLIHGFLTPSLIIVGNDGEALVTCFGLTRGLRANLDRIAVKKMAAPYLAPEVLANGRPSGRSDVYSLGAILYHLLTAMPLPAEPDERAAALEKPQLGFDEGPVPQDVLAIVQKTLAGRPEDRYASAADFKRELERLLYGGAYSPTTFNLALFMDRLYRSEIEQEDRELERERVLDIAPYYQPPKVEAVEVPSPVTEPPRPSRTFLYAIAGGAAILLSVIVYLLVSRPSSKPVDQEAQKRMLQELVNTQVTAALKEKEEQLRKELEAEKARTQELRQQLDKQQSAAGGARRIPADEQQRLQSELAAREAEQKRKEEELARVRQQQESEAARARDQQAQLAARPVAQPTVAAGAAAAAGAMAGAGAAGAAGAVAPPAPAVPVSMPPVAPASAAAGAATTAAAPAGQAPTAAGRGVVEGDLVNPAEVDALPETLVETKVTLPRALARTPLSGFVTLKVLVNEKGGVDDVAVVHPFSPPTPRVDEACVTAVKQRRYKPAMKDGQRVKTWIMVKLIFAPAAR
jgi:TonB family protein